MAFDDIWGTAAFWTSEEFVIECWNLSRTHCGCFVVLYLVQQLIDGKVKLRKPVVVQCIKN